MKKNLFKKVAAFVTATSMVASLGTVAFAENFDGTGIEITDVTYDKTFDDDGEVVPGVYNVTVSYEVADGVKNDIGVTMLAYTGENLSVDTKYNDSMQIVGIDQQKQSEEQTGSFEFKVTTNDDGAIKVAYGVPSIILVSGDKVAPAAAAFTIKWEVASANYEGGAMTIEPPEDGDVVAAIEAKLAADGVTLKDADEKAEKKLTGDALNVTVAPAGDATYDPDNTDAQELEYTVTVNFEGDAEAVVPAGTVLTFTLKVKVSDKPAGTYGDLNGDDELDAADVAQLWAKIEDSTYVFHDMDDNSVIDDTYAKLNEDDELDAADVAQLWAKIEDSTHVFPAEKPAEKVE